MATFLNRSLSVRSAVRGARTAVLSALVLLAAAGGARAAVSYDVTVGLPVGDDARVFLNITNQYYAPPQETATVLIHRCARPEDDYPAVLFLAQASGRPPGAILDLRLRGMSWADILFTLQIRPSVLFVGLDRDPGPPYGKAWGHWRNHPRGRLTIADRDFVDLVKLQITTRHYRVSPYTVIAERRKGVTIEHYVHARHAARGGGPSSHPRAARAEKASPEKASPKNDHPSRTGKPKDHPKPHH